MHTPTYTSTGKTINKAPVMLIEPVVTPIQQLTAMLDEINFPKITFKFGIRIERRQRVLSISKNKLGYTACVEHDNDNRMLSLASLSEKSVASILQRVKLEYGK